jgi:putative hydrolase of the HAD superfamily
MDPYYKTTAVLIDLDDTLFDQTRSAEAGLAALRARFDALAARPLAEIERANSATLERLHQDVLAGLLSIEAARRLRMARLLEAAGAPATDADVEEAASLYRRAYVDSWCAVPGARALLERLRRDARVAVVTNNLREEQTQKLASCGLADLVDALVVWEDLRIMKPDPEIFRLALRRLGGHEASAVVLGDSWEADVVGAAAAGIRAVWLNRRGIACPDPRMAVEIRALEPVEEIAKVVLTR